MITLIYPIIYDRRRAATECSLATGAEPRAVTRALAVNPKREQIAAEQKCKIGEQVCRVV